MDDWPSVGDTLRLVLCLRMTGWVSWDYFLSSETLLPGHLLGTGLLSDSSMPPDKRQLLMKLLVQPLSDLREILIMTRDATNPAVRMTLMVLSLPDRRGLPYNDIVTLKPLLQWIWSGIQTFKAWGVKPVWPMVDGPTPMHVKTVRLDEIWLCRTTGGWQPFWQDTQHSWEEVVQASLL